MCWGYLILVMDICSYLHEKGGYPCVTHATSHVKRSESMLPNKEIKRVRRGMTHLILPIYRSPTLKEDPHSLLVSLLRSQSQLSPAHAILTPLLRSDERRHWPPWSHTVPSHLCCEKTLSHLSLGDIQSIEYLLCTLRLLVRNPALSSKICLERNVFLLMTIPLISLSSATTLLELGGNSQARLVLQSLEITIEII